MSTTATAQVRQLATRSADAAHEIKALIQTRVKRVQAGSALAHEAGSTMTEVATTIQRVSTLMREISEASDRQTQDMVRATQAIVRMDEATQQNAVLVEDSAAAAGSLSLETAVGCARQCRDRRAMQGETTRRTPVRKKEQRCMARLAWCWRAHSAFTQKVSALTRRNFNGHQNFSV